MASTTWVLDDESSWALLRRNDVGRLAVSIRGHPFVFPVSYLVDGDVIVFRTGEGTKLDNLFSSPSIALEIDHVDLEAGEAWSVVVAGHAMPVAGADRIAELETRLPPTRLTDDARYLIELRPQEISGRMQPHDTH